VKNGVDQLNRHQDDQEHRAILDWLTPTDYALQKCDFLARRQEGTGQWLLGSNEFQQWLNTSKQTLFCPGIPGAGKTIISSTVVDHLNAKFEKDTEVGIAYMYCSYQLQQTEKLQDLISSLLKQLVQKKPVMLADVKKLYEFHRTKGTRPSFEDIVNVLHPTIQLYSRVFIIIDALDEYYVSQNELKELLSKLFDLRD
jgi:Cdc6-like AAA superfamily ATPase